MKKRNERPKEEAKGGHNKGSVERWALSIMVIVALAMSAHALYDIGLAAGLGLFAVGLPVILDGFAILAARVVAQLSAKAARAYPWTLLILLGAISVWANAMHARPTTIGELELSLHQAQFISALPPIALGLGYHMYLMVAREHEPVPEPEPEPKPERKRGPRPGSKRGEFERKAREVWADAKAAGRREPTGNELAKRIGSSPATGRRLVTLLRREEAEAETDAEVVPIAA